MVSILKVLFIFCNEYNHDQILAHMIERFLVVAPQTTICSVSLASSVI